eukprot:CAMPEP_0175067454 /NCGR_PEP_ID=MMETSP0052_2-20121109/17108_1 /TAXON_ID=51329 ORGANISM="Polytomella parva, Strain SAG 63-3" /NCGR_SAMPLE_ID=MMETSP0052_2 /ASSEMBLY_ACC=CAM_ASM_000194 /LENGTH=735 /DNA_ID=CAMNT_0016334339 /DNA_START=54 /DNA_END=2262 /DNA_ORIENTATION=+
MGMDDSDIIPLSQHVNSLPIELFSGDHNFGRDPQELENCFDYDSTKAFAKRRKGKLFNDPIHGHFLLDPICVDIIDTKPFQRLRNLLQLGLTYHVFPGACHHRFEHSLGTCHLAYRVANQIYQNQRNELDMDQSDVMVAQLAGLCHDLGHGPFSHLFSDTFLKNAGVTDWTHESMSCRILDYIVEKYDLKIAPFDIQRIQQLINPEAGKGHWAKNKQFLFDIVSNSRNGVDVDKMDYLNRDATMCGVRISFDYQRLLGMQKVIDNEICYKWSEYHNLYELYHSRASMHRRVYTHRKSKAFELMTADVLLAAEPVLKMCECIQNPELFINFDDSILRTIETYHVAFRHVVEEGAGGVCLEDARKIIDRIRHRDLYRFCTECQVPSEWIQDDRWAKFRTRGPVRAEDIANSPHSFGGQITLAPEDIIICENRIDFTKGKENPLDHIRFFTEYEDKMSRQLDRTDIMNLGTNIFQERTLRAYSKIGTPQHVAAVAEAFSNYVRKLFGSSQSGPCTTRSRDSFAPYGSASHASPSALWSDAESVPQSDGGGKKQRRDEGASGGGEGKGREEKGIAVNSSTMQSQDFSCDNPSTNSLGGRNHLSSNLHDFNANNHDDGDDSGGGNGGRRIEGGSGNESGRDGSSCRKDYYNERGGKGNKSSRMQWPHQGSEEGSEREPRSQSLNRSPPIVRLSQTDPYDHDAYNNRDEEGEEEEDPDEGERGKQAKARSREMPSIQPAIA